MGRKRIQEVEASGGLSQGWVWCGAVFLILLLVLAGYGKWHGIRVPRTHDEFAYLLSADTFASGRLTNPTHAMWPHFETFHVFHKPTYQAKYPPAQGGFIALGILGEGEPIVGVWLSFAAAITALAWMLAYDGRWGIAALFAATAALQPAIFRAWGNTFWGGAVAMLGGALLWGGLLRLRTRLWWPYSAAMGLGLLILSQSRQLEGLVMGVFAIGVLAIWMRGSWRSDRRSILIQVLLPLSIFAVVICTFTLIYNAVLSAGNPFKLAYLNWSDSTSSVELVRSYAGSREIGNLRELSRLASFFVSPWMALLFLGVLMRQVRGPTLMAVVGCLLLVVLSVSVSKSFPHYLAPAAPLLWLLFRSGWDGLWQRREVMWRTVAVAAIATQLVVGAWTWWSKVRTPEVRNGWHHRRADIQSKLESLPGKDLVLVSYGPEHSIDKEWVYNAADIDDSPVVWARFIDPESDQRLLEYFGDRQVWRLEADPVPPILELLDPAP